MTKAQGLSALLAALLTLGALSACDNTFRGMGQDAEEAGDAVEDATDDLGS